MRNVVVAAWPWRRQHAMALNFVSLSDGLMSSSQRTLNLIIGWPWTDVLSYDRVIHAVLSHFWLDMKLRSCGKCWFIIISTRSWSFVRVR
jgi:hypothetical protein